MFCSRIMSKSSTIQEYILPQFKLETVGDFSERRDVRHHAHTYTELVYILNGQCVSDNGGNSKLPAEAGMAYLIPPGAIHNQKGFCATVFLGFSIPVEEEPDEMLLLDLRHDPWVRHWLKDLLQLYRNNRHGEVYALALAIYLHIRDSIRQQQTIPGLHPDTLLNSAIIYIDNNYSKKITAGSIARSMHCSVSTLNNCFRRYSGKSLMRYVYDFRLSIGKQLLSNDYLSIGEIAWRCGFASLNYFVRAFRQRYGIAPGEMRKQQKKAGCCPEKR